MVKLLQETDFMQLLSKYIEMYKYIKPGTPDSAVGHILIQEISRPGFLALGYFKGDKLIGFISGYTLKDKSYFISGVYCEVPIYLPKLVRSFETRLKLNNFHSWSTEMHFNHDKCLAPKLGAKIDYIRYKKEI